MERRKPTKRPATVALYEINIRLHLVPGLGTHQLRRLSVPIVQTFLNNKLKAGQSVRNVQILRQILSAALTRAVREELVARNVARLVELPTWQPAEVVPWTPAEALAFLKVAADDPLSPAFVLLLLYGMQAVMLVFEHADVGQAVLLAVPEQGRRHLFGGPGVCGHEKDLVYGRVNLAIDTRQSADLLVGHAPSTWRATACRDCIIAAPAAQ